MFQDTLQELENKLRSGSLPEKNREELLRLIATLKEEVSGLARTDREKARSIAGFAEVSAFEATRDNKDPALMKLSLQGLTSSVDGFEKSHPQLVDLVNRFCTTLSSLGI